MYTIAALYHFTRFEDPAALQAPLRAVCAANAVRGSLLLAGEGINGTIAGPRDGLNEVLAHIRGLPGCAGLEWKESTSDSPPFGRLKVRLKKEIVALGVPGVDPKAAVGHYVRARDWNALISAPDVAVIDTRNDYETAIGTFRGQWTRRPKASATSPPGGRRTRTGFTISGSRCSAPAVSAARNRPTT